jgi:hypothetical protein
MIADVERFIQDNLAMGLVLTNNLKRFLPSRRAFGTAAGEDPARMALLPVARRHLFFCAHTLTRVAHPARNNRAQAASQSRG